MITWATYDVVVVGGGHAGCEAALAAARMGLHTALVTLHIDKIALMPCNPAVGGVGKGQLTRELDALGGEQGRNTDRASIQVKMLNTSKGPAVRALRAQADKRAYEDWMKHVLFRTPRLHVIQGETAGLDVSRETIRAVYLADGRRLGARAVVIATGTFMRGKIVVGNHSFEAGRMGELPASSLSRSLEEAGIELGRFQSATPPRIDGRTICRDRMEEQPGDPDPIYFSHWAVPRKHKQVSCFLTYTTSHTHQVVADNLELSPIRSGSVEGTGPRYCPSIDRKVVNFPDRDRHPVFVEPEGTRTHEMYLQGLTTSMPVFVQEKIIRSTPGLERAELVRPGYAVEYDYVVPDQLSLSLEVRAVRGLFSAGQINGTSGYEEAAAQGLMAGINAVRYVREEEPFVLRRDQAYIGVLIDDLVTKGVDEPYRMFTSRAEYRLLLRHDNAANRLAELGYELGLLREEQVEQVREKRRVVDELATVIEGAQIPADDRTAEILESAGTTALSEPQSAARLFRRPEVGLRELLELLQEQECTALRRADSDVLEQLVIRAQYDGYIQRQLEQIERSRRTEEMKIPPDLPVGELGGITVEAQTKLARHRPLTVGQASRIAGVSPADISVLVMHIHRHLRPDSGRGEGGSGDSPKRQMAAERAG